MMSNHYFAYGAAENKKAIVPTAFSPCYSAIVRSRSPTPAGQFTSVLGSQTRNVACVPFNGENDDGVVVYRCPMTNRCTSCKHNADGSYWELLQECPDFEKNPTARSAYTKLFVGQLLAKPCGTVASKEDYVAKLWETAALAVSYVCLVVGRSAILRDVRTDAKKKGATAWILVRNEDAKYFLAWTQRAVQCDSECMYVARTVAGAMMIHAQQQVAVGPQPVGPQPNAISLCRHSVTITRAEKTSERNQRKNQAPAEQKPLAQAAVLVYRHDPYLACTPCMG